jgi:hypothetical protein
MRRLLNHLTLASLLIFLTGLLALPIFSSFPLRNQKLGPPGLWLRVSALSLSQGLTIELGQSLPENYTPSHLRYERFPLGFELNQTQEPASYNSFPITYAVTGLLIPYWFFVLTTLPLPLLWITRKTRARLNRPARCSQCGAVTSPLTSTSNSNF